MDDEDWDRDAVIVGQEDLRDFNNDNVLPQSRETLLAIRNWLQPTDYDNEGGEHRKYLESHLAGTGDWLFASKEYQLWRHGHDDGLLWIRGIPGSGKSVFAASIIDRLQRKACPVLYFYFRQIIDANHSPMAALRDWLAQLLPFSPPLQESLKRYMDHHRDIGSLSSMDLWAHVRQAAVNIPTVFFVVDALDEMDQTKDLEPFLQSLSALGSWQPSRVKVMATSRPVAHIETPWRGARAVHIRLEERLVDLDIAAYVQHMLSRSTIPEEIQARIKAAVPGRANGLFLYAKLAMDAFLRPGADPAHVLQKLPQDLGVMYTHLLREHSRRSGVPDDTQLLILQAVTHASRPLRLLEIAEFINITDTPPEKRDLKKAKDTVRSACGPLLEILPDETVSVVHHSLTEFLNGSTRSIDDDSALCPVLKPGPSHHRLALTCLAYLEFVLSLPSTPAKPPQKNPRVGVTPRLSDRQAVQLAHPFSQYAIENWHVHTRKAEENGQNLLDMHESIDRLLRPESHPLQRWKSLGLGLSSSTHGSHENVSFMEMAVELGLVSYVSVLLTRRGDGGKDSGKFFLWAAAAVGHHEMVALLLRAGANPRESSPDGYSPLRLAARANHARVAQTLIATGEDPFSGLSRKGNACEGNACSPVFWACQNGHVEVMAEFLQHADTSKKALHALRAAVGEGRPQILQMVLQNSLVDVNATDRLGRSALHHACIHANPQTLRLLLGAGADPNLRDSSCDKTTPLYYLARAAASRRIDNKTAMECFGLLVAAGGDVNHINEMGDTALNHVKSPAAVRILLNAGADPNIPDEKGMTLLHRCSNTRLLRILLAGPKVDLERRSDDGLTPLLSAIHHGRFRIAHVLLAHNARPTTADDKGNGPFHYAVRMPAKNETDDDESKEDETDENDADVRQVVMLVRSLHEHGGDVRIPNFRRETALHTLLTRREGRSFSWEPMVRALLEAGADLEARDRLGRTPFFRMLSSEMARDGFAPDLAKKFGAQLDTVDFQGQSVFHYHCKSRERNFDMFGGRNLNLDAVVFSALAGAGLDPGRIDHQGRTLWHACAPWMVKLGTRSRPGLEMDKNGHPRGLTPLIELGIDMLRPDHTGRTPLHLAAMQGTFAGHWNDSTAVHGVHRRPGTVFEYMISRYSDAGVDQVDHDGVTALHLASTHCPLNTRLLLRAGADASKATKEGLTPLHLAARSRRPNIVGILLRSLESSCSGKDFLQAVNAQDNCYWGSTPLLHACISGQVASVRLLLEAGATAEASRPWLDSPWMAIAQYFDEEDKRWTKPDPDHLDPPVRKVDAASVTFADKTRPPVERSSRHLSGTMIDEIVDLLGVHLPPTLETLSSAAITAARSGSEYVTECLVRERSELFPTAASLTDVGVKLSMARRQVSRTIVVEGAQKPPAVRSAFDRLMKMKDQDAAARLVLETGGLRDNQLGFQILQDLVQGGFASTLKKVASKALASQMLGWAEYGSAMGRLGLTSGLPSGTRYPLLHLACQTEILNMDVIRVLVDEIGVDVNQATEWHGSGPTAPRDRLTALHLLAQGRYWWQAALAIPYLIAKGAHLEARDAAGQTPLLAALGAIGSASFDQTTITVLLREGADPNAFDSQGRSCLAWAVQDVPMLNVLLEHGAVPTYSAMAASIDRQVPEALELFLMRGSDPNAMRTSEEQKKMLEMAGGDPLIPKRVSAPSTDDEEIPNDGDVTLIDRAARAPLDRHTRSFSPIQQLIKLLLDHGADPNTRYAKTTVMHRIVRRGRLVHMFLDLPNLEIEARDAQGATILHVACRRVPSKTCCEPDVPPDRAPLFVVDKLLGRGANVRARTNAGRTVFHSMAMSSPRKPGPSLVRHLADVAPDLIDEHDVHGERPLFTALKKGNGGVADALLAVGADPRLPDQQGNTPLHLLLVCPWDVDGKGELRATCPVASAVRRLRDAGVDVNARNRAGETPLFFFFRQWTVEERGETAVMELLEEAGVDWRAVNSAGESLLHVVARPPKFYRSGVARFRFLMGKGLDPLAEDAAHRTALDVAASVGHKDILRLFKRGEEEAAVLHDEDDDW